MPKVVYEKDGKIGRITLNRPEVMNAIDDDLPAELSDCVGQANADPGVHVIILSGAGRAFCAGYNLTYYAQASGGTGVTQAMPWDPMKDYAFMMRNTDLFMSLLTRFNDCARRLWQDQAGSLHSCRREKHS